MRLHNELFIRSQIMPHRIQCSMKRKIKKRKKESQINMSNVSLRRDFLVDQCNNPTHNKIYLRYFLMYQISSTNDIFLKNLRNFQHVYLRAIKKINYIKFKEKDFYLTQIFGDFTKCTKLFT